MLSCLVQRLNLVDKQFFVAAGHSDSQDQLQEPGHILHLEPLVRVDVSNVWHRELIIVDALLAEVVTVVVEEHVEQHVQCLGVIHLGLEHSSKPGYLR